MHRECSELGVRSAVWSLSFWAGAKNGHGDVAPGATRNQNNYLGMGTLSSASFGGGGLKFRKVFQG